MTGVALDIAHVILGYDLGECRRFRDVRFVTARTQSQGLRKLGNNIGRTGGMFCQRTVTGFAIDACVLAGFLHFHNVCVTVFARLVSSKPRLAGGDLFQGLTTVVTKLSETLRNEICPENQENDNANDEDGREAQKMLDVVKLAHG